MWFFFVYQEKKFFLFFVSCDVFWKFVKRKKTNKQSSNGTVHHSKEKKGRIDVGCLLKERKKCVNWKMNRFTLMMMSLFFVLFMIFSFTSHPFSTFLRCIGSNIMIENLFLFQLFQKRLQLLIDVRNI